jgi:hypothetical protein
MAALHEYGHALGNRRVLKRQAVANFRFGAPGDSIMLSAERNANKRVLNQLTTNGAPAEDLKTWRNWANDQFKINYWDTSRKTHIPEAVPGFLNYLRDTPAKVYRHGLTPPMQFPGLQTGAPSAGQMGWMLPYQRKNFPRYLL